MIIQGKSAKYVALLKYEVQAEVINNTGKPLMYLPVFANIKSEKGDKIGFVMGGTGQMLKPGDTTPVIMDTVIPKELGKPDKVELFSE